MKVGIRFSDNDFSMIIKAFMDMFILPTFIEREEGHMVTHLTSPMIVELFNKHLPYVDRYMKWYFSLADSYPYRHNKKEKLYDNDVHAEYLKITEMNVYWDNNTDKYISDWNENNNCEFIWTDGKEVYIT